ncbi:MAG: glutaminase, partial [Flavobacterium sp.]
MNLNIILNEVYTEVLSMNLEGKVSNSIPELSKIDPTKFGIYLVTLDGQNYGVGDSNERFSIQSVSKPLTLAMAFSKLGEKVWERVDVEPSGDPFNSLVQLEYEKGIPRNPFINAGAIVIADMIVSLYK